MRRALLGVGIAAIAALGAKVALAQLDPTPGDIFRVSVSGGGPANLTASPDNDTNPVVSPDGTRIAFVSDRGESGQLRRTHVHVFIVGTDGQGLQQVSSALSSDQSFDGQIAWSPDGKRLVVTATVAAINGSLATTLYLLEPGKPQRAIARAPIILAPAWSPSGRVIGFNTGDSRKPQVWGVTPAGKRAWRVQGRSFLQPAGGWSAAGRLAVLGYGRIHVYDERGRPQLSLLGRAFSWSLDGKRLASLVRDRLEVRTLSRRVVFSKAVPGLHDHNGLVWADGTHIVLGVGGLQSNDTTTVDLANGRFSRGGLRYFGSLSPNRRLVAEIAQVGGGVVLRVSRLDGSEARALARRPNCPDLIEGDIHWLPNGRSLVYDLRCQGR